MLRGRTILTVSMPPSAMFLGERYRVACLVSWRTRSPLPDDFSKVQFSPMFSMARGPPSRRTAWGISCAFSWTYAFLSSLSADQPLRYCGFCPGRPESSRLLGKSDGHGVWLQGIRRTTHPVVERAPWAG